MVYVSRPGGGITLNAGLPDYLLDDAGELMAFKGEAEARKYLLRHGMTEDEISICDFHAIPEPTP
jgi:hypothetical protein